MKSFKILQLDRLSKYKSLFISTFFVLLFIVPIHSFSQDDSGSFYHDGRLREYDVYLPQGFQPNMPLVLALHGFGGNRSVMAQWTELHDYADTLGFVVAYPQGLSLSGMSGWNNGYRPNPGDHGANDTTSNDVGFLSALIDTLHSQYSIDLYRVYCCGFSQGAQMTYRMAMERGERFAAFAGVGGKLNDISGTSGIPDRSYPILHVHGTADSVSKYYGPGIGNTWSVDSTLSYWRQNSNCAIIPTVVGLPDIDPLDGSTVTKYTWDDCADSTQIILYQVIGGNHNWPGSVHMNPSYPLNKDIITSLEILEFFGNYTNPAPKFVPGSDHLVLDSLAIGCYQVDTLVVRNGGDETLIIANAFSDSSFITVEPESTTIMSADSGLFLITSTPPDEGPYSGNIIFNHNGLGSPDTVQVSGTGVGEGPATMITVEGTGWQMISPGVIHTVEPNECPIVLSLSYCYEGGYLREDTLEAGSGYWYKMSGSMTFTGTHIDTLSVEVTNRWNLIGTISVPVPVATITSTPPEMSTTGFYQYDGTGYSITDTLYPGYAYWVKVSENGWLFLSSTGGTNLLSRIVIRHTDEMPPPPPVRSGAITPMIPTEYSLEQNYPNPFNPVTTIRYVLPVSAHVTLSVFNILGQKVTDLVNEEQEAGYKSVDINAGALPSGVYVYKLTAGSFTDVKKMLLLK